MPNMFRCNAAALALINMQQRTARGAEDPIAFRTLQSLSPSPPRPLQLFTITQDTLKVSLDTSFETFSIVTYFVPGHRVCANPLSVLRLTAQQPTTPPSSPPNLRPPSRHTMIGNSGQGVIPILDCPETHPTSDLPESSWCKLVIYSPFWASLTIESRMGNTRTPTCQVPEP
jgi:hypothetical protein